MKSVWAFSLGCAVLLSTSAGCGTRVRTYTVEKDRVDQNLAQGNAGYLTGAPDPSELNRPRKLTRQTYVAEIELPSGGRRSEWVEEVSQEGRQEFIREAEATPAAKRALAMPIVSTYTVKDNDTLAKISLKVYGTSKRWKKIFEANADKLKSPDRIYAGQVLKIPQE